MDDFKTIEDLIVLYEDNHIIVVLKPQNVPTCPDESGNLDLFSVVKEYIRVKYNKPGNVFLGLVHRLDRPTGGVMVFAKTSKAAARLSDSIRLGEFKKMYYCITYGKITYKHGENITNYLLKDEKNNIVTVVPMATTGAKIAVLDYDVLETKEPYSLVAVHLKTGRAHQIRVQLKTLGFPILGDEKYNPDCPTKIPNLALWAVQIKFPHPTTRETMVFRIYPPTEDIPWNSFDVSKFLNVSI
ncbi:MAG: RluA family pseudouridine synthase, partial [Clostridia bacterium]|nr:RluA family pseudouridine synthase [Clostridia bacterium]